MKKSFILYPLLTLLLVIFITSDPLAIPAFARKYHMSCTTCHSPAMPSLKAYGDDFAGNGFRMADLSAPRYFVNTGDDRLSLIRNFPIAVRLEGHALYSNENSDALEFGFPWSVKLLSGGEISKKLSYYFYFYMSEKGELAGIEDAFLTYSDLLGTGINISAGQFQVSDPLYKRELRLTLEDYMIYTLKPGTSSISLKYDRGIILDYSLPTGTSFVGEIVNGNGIGEAGTGFLFDKDSYKNYFLKGSQSIGDYFDAGIFGYYGKEALDENGGGLTNEMLFWGPNLSFNLNDKFIINLQYARRTDSDVILEGEENNMQDVLTHGGFAEIIIAPGGDMSSWYITLLGNWVESDISNLDYNSATFHAGYLLRRNVRLVGEYTHQFANQEYDKASVGFVAAF